VVDIVAVTVRADRLMVTSACGRWRLGRCGRVPASWAGAAWAPVAGVVTGGKDFAASDWAISGTVSGSAGMVKSGFAKSNAAVRSPATERRQAVMLAARTPVQVSRKRSIEVWS
jgi:hypothetical protein